MVFLNTVEPATHWRFNFASKKINYVVIML